MNSKKLLSLFVWLIATVTSVVVAQQPYGGCWHPDYIKNWTPESDPDAKFNRSTVPLQARFYDDGIKANNYQFYDGKVAACLTMNPMCSQTPSQGADNFIGYNPNYWQYLDMLVWWGGSAGEGIIIPPSAPVTDIAHLNGVKVLGNIFFPPAAYGGDVKWVKQMLTKEGNTYPYAKKLYEIAKYYGFDGWFINEETGGGSKAEWTAFVAYFYECAKAGGDESMQIQWYNMAVSASNHHIKSILSLSPYTSFFANYGSAFSGAISSNMQTVEGLGFTKKQAFSKLYSGIECAQGGLYGNKGSFDACFPTSGHKSSIQMFNPEEHIWKQVVKDLLNSNNAQGSQAYSAMKQVFKNAEGWWVNSDKDPSNVSDRSGAAWPGTATGIMERSAIQAKPFISSFSMGLGKHRFVNGINKGTQDWYHRGMQDILPTWRWWVDVAAENKTHISFHFTWDDAYNVGSSLEVNGMLAANVDYLTRLYKTKIAVESGDQAQVVYKTAHAGTISLKLATSDAPSTFIDFPVSETKNKNGWSIATIDISSLQGKTLSVIAINFKSTSDINNYNVKLGQIGILPADYTPAAPQVKNLQSQNQLKEEISDIRLIWDAPVSNDVHHYNVYMERNGEKKLVGQTRNEGFYIPKFTRISGSEKEVNISVATVTKDLKEGNPVELQLKYPEMGAPVVQLKAMKTLIKIGEEVTVLVRANNAPETYTWTIPKNAELVSQTDNKAVFKFNKEGRYDIKVNVANTTGSTDCVVTEYIEVSQSKEIEIVSVGKSIADVSGWLGSEKPEHLIDGVQVPNDIHAKWCDGKGKKSHWVIIDLESNYKLYRFKIWDTGHKENFTDNFKNFKIEISKDRENWTEVLKEEGRPENTKDDWIKPTVGRYIRFTPYDKEMPITIRIWEFEAFGIQGNLSLEKPEDTEININESKTISLAYSLEGDPKNTNFKVDVTTNATPNMFTIENIVIEDALIKFNIKAGSEMCKDNVTVKIINGDFERAHTFSVKIQDPSLTNILLNKIPTATIDGQQYDDPNNEKNTEGAVGIKGMTDGSKNTWWSSPWRSALAKQKFVFDLSKTYKIYSINTIFKDDHNKYIKLPYNIQLYTSTTEDNDDAYKEIINYTESNADGTTKVIIPIRNNNEYILPKAAEAKYLKAEITIKYNYGFSLVEIEARGKEVGGSSIKPVSQEMSSRVYPNPVNRGKTVFVETEAGATVCIVSLQGIVLKTTTAISHKCAMETSNIPAGTYLITNKWTNGRTNTSKLIIK